MLLTLHHIVVNTLYCKVSSLLPLTTWSSLMHGLRTGILPTLLHKIKLAILCPYALSFDGMIPNIRVPEQFQSRRRWSGWGNVQYCQYILTNENYQCVVTNDIISMVIQEWNNSWLYLYTWDALLVECVAHWSGCCKAQPQLIGNAGTVALNFRDTLKDASSARSHECYIVLNCIGTSDTVPFMFPKL